MQKSAIIYGNWASKTHTREAACFLKGGNLPKIYSQPHYAFLSLQGIRKDGVPCVTFSTPAGSFFIPAVESRERAVKPLTHGGRLMPYAQTIAEELRTAVRCSRRVALRATKGQTTTRSRDLNRINLATLEANVLSIAEKADMEMELRQEQVEDHPSTPTRP